MNTSEETDFKMGQETPAENNNNIAEPKSVTIKYDTPYTWVVIAAIILSCFASHGFVFGATSVFASQYPVILNKTQTETNIIGSTVMGGYMLSAPLSSLFCKKFGSRVTSAIGSVLVMSSVLISAFSSQLWHFILGFSIPCALGSSLLAVSSIIIVHQYCNRLKNIALASIGLGISLGDSFPLILNAIANSGATFRQQYLYLIGISALTITAPIIYRPRTRPETDSVSKKISSATLLKPIKRCYTPIFLGQAFLWFSAFNSFLLLLFSEVADHYGEDVATTSNTLLGAGRLTSAILLPLLLAKLQLNITLLQMISNLVGGICMFLFAGIINMYSFYVISFVLGIAFGAIISFTPMYPYFVYRKDESDMAYSYQMAMGGIASFVGPMLTSYIKSSIGSSTAFYFIGGLAIVAGILIGVGAIVRPSTMKPANPPDLGTNDIVDPVKLSETAMSISGEQEAVDSRNGHETAESQEGHETVDSREGQLTEPDKNKKETTSKENTTENLEPNQSYDNKTFDSV